MRKLLALAIGTVIAIAASGLALRLDSVQLWLKLNARHPIHANSGPDGAWISEQDVWYLCGLDRVGDHFAYDSVAALRPLPDQETRFEWPEHPAGSFVQHTNDIALVEREQVPTAKSGPRILIAGDSHTSGMVGTDETFAHVLETRLSGAPGWEGADVLNAGCAFTGPRCYLGTFEKYVHLEPDVFIAVLFLGNDFWDDLAFDYQLRGWTRPLPGSEYVERLELAREDHAGPLFQGFNLVYRWKHVPAERSRSFELVVESFVRMSERCAEEGVRFLAVVLPTKMEVDADDTQQRREVCEVLGMTEADLDVLADMGDRFAAKMNELGIACLDPRPAMEACEEPLYWTLDYHLGLRGHALLAELLERELRGAE